MRTSGRYGFCALTFALFYTEPTCVDGGGDELRATRLKRLHDMRREVAELERLLGVSSSPDHLYSLDFKVEVIYHYNNILKFEHEDT